MIRKQIRKQTTCPGATRAFLSAVLVLVCCAAGLSAAEGPAGKPDVQKIDKLYFMIHPACWSGGMQNGQPPPLPEGFRKEDYVGCYVRELETHKRQKALISRMKHNEALIIFPIGSTPQMLELQQHAKKTLGDRCVIIPQDSVDPPAEWAELSHPIKRFLDDENLAGREEFLKSVPQKIRAELSDEIREACRTHGYEWNIRALEVVYFSRRMALQIEEEFKKRSLGYDPQTVESEAFGEGFEECAMHWKAMTVPYLGLAKPAENLFDLSVSGARFLLKAKLKERVSLDNDVRLFLWEGTDGELIGFYARAWCRLKDPQFFARIPLGGELEVWSQHKYGTKLWPAGDSPLKATDEHLEVPVLNGIRRDEADRTCYVIGRDIAFDEFRRRLVDAKIVE